MELLKSPIFYSVFWLFFSCACCVFLISAIYIYQHNVNTELLNTQNNSTVINELASSVDKNKLLFNQSGMRTSSGKFDGNDMLYLFSSIIPLIISLVVVNRFKQFRIMSSAYLLVSLALATLTLLVNNSIQSHQIENNAYLNILVFCSIVGLLMTLFIAFFESKVNALNWFVYPLSSVVVFLVLLFLLDWVLALPIDIMNTLQNVSYAAIMFAIFVGLKIRKEISAIQSVTIFLSIFYIVLIINQSDFIIFSQLVALSAGFIAAIIFLSIRYWEISLRYKTLENSIALERDIVRRELHDGLLNDLVAVGVTNNGLKRLADKENDKFSVRLQTIDDIILTMSQRMRSLLRVSGAVKTEWNEFITDLTSYITNLLESGNIRTQVKINGDALKVIAPETDVLVNLELSIRELIINILKHAKASNVELIIDINSELFQVTIKNNGISYIGSFPNKKTDSFGLQNIESRLASVSANIDLWEDDRGWSVSQIRRPINSF